MPVKARNTLGYYSILVCYFVLTLIIYALLIHSQFSFCQSDESFYISTTNRWLQGDAMIVDEWQPAQFYTVILLPFLFFYKIIVPSLAGVILYFRVLYLLWSGLVSIVFFQTLSKHTNLISALLGTILLLLYSRANIAGPSYYNLCIRFIQMAWALRYASTIKRWRQILSGVFCALAVLCQPYFAPFVVLFMILGLLRKSTRSYTGNAILGIGLIAVLFLAFLLSRANISQVVNNLSYVVTDPQHVESFSYKVTKIIQQQELLLPISTLLLILLLATVCTVMKLTKQKDSPWLSFVQIIVLIVSIFIPLREINNVACYSFYYCISIAVLPTVVHSILSRKDKELIILYIGGICVAISFAIGSNTYLDAMTCGYCISSVAGLMMLSNRLTARVERRTTIINTGCTGLLSLFCVLVVFFSAATRFVGIYRDAPLIELSNRITYGPAKGLLTSDENKRQYNTIYDTLREVGEDESKSILHLPKTPWAYLCTDMRCAGPTTWTTPISSKRIMEYIELHEKRLPEVVVIYSEQVGSYLTVSFNNHTASLRPSYMEMKGEFLSVLQKQYKLKVENDYMKVFEYNGGQIVEISVS